MSDQDEILHHVEYGLKHIDGLIWLCDQLVVWERTGERPESVEIAFDGAPAAKGKVGLLQNPLAETGLIYCRKLLDFLGIKVSGKEPHCLVEVNDKGRRPDDRGVEQLGLPRLTIDELALPDEVEEACIRTIRAANKGVAHFTENRGEKLSAEQAIICAGIVVQAIEERVYDALEIERPKPIQRHESGGVPKSATVIR